MMPTVIKMDFNLRLVKSCKFPPRKNMKTNQNLNNKTKNHNSLNSKRKWKVRNEHHTLAADWLQHTSTWPAVSSPHGAYDVQFTC